MKFSAVLFGCLVFFFSITLHAQTESDGKWPFVNYQSNNIHYDSSSPSLQRFVALWHNMRNGQGKVNVVHIGGSHVQAGILPDRIRLNLLSQDGVNVGSRGLIFPYSAAAKCNNPPDYRIHCPQPVTLTRNVYKTHDYPLGVSGIAVTAHDCHTEMQVVLVDEGVNYATTGVTLIGTPSGAVLPRLRVGVDDFFPVLADSVSGRYVFCFDRQTDSFVVVLPCKVGESFTVGGLYLRNQSDGLTYSSIGVNGAAVPDYLRCSNFVRDMRMLQPDMIVFGIGINDAVPYDFDTAAFRRNYLSLIDSVRLVSPDCLFVFVTNNDSFRKVGRRKYVVNNNGLQVREVFYRLAKETGGVVWDQFEVMGGLKSMDKWYKNSLAKVDRVHFTVSGYRLIGDLFSQALLEMINSVPVTTSPNMR